MEDNNEELLNDSRFVLDFSTDVTFMDKNGKPIETPIEDYINDSLKDIVCFDEIEIGDIIKTRYTNKYVIITDLNFKVEAFGGIFDFAGYVIGREKEGKTLLNRRDIQEVCQKASDVLKR